MKGDIGKWEVHINFTDYSRRCEIYIARWCEGEWCEYITKINGEQSELKRAELHETIKPSMVFYSGMAEQIMQSFADACEKNGFRAKGSPILVNELTAIKYHLEDMRKLIFKEKK